MFNGQIHTKLQQCEQEAFLSVENIYLVPNLDSGNVLPTAKTKHVSNQTFIYLSPGRIVCPEGSVQRTQCKKVLV
jgi:hypothetical protein